MYRSGVVRLYLIARMNALDSLKIATSIGTLVQRALDVRKQWSEQHVQGAAGDLKLKEQWEETEPFWKPWFRGHADARWQLKPKLYRDGELNVEKLFRFEEELRGEFKRRGSQLAEGLRLPDHGPRPVQYLKQCAGTRSSGYQAAGPRESAFSLLLGSLAHDRRLRSDSYDPQRPGVLECGGCEGRSAAPLHSRSVRGDELNFQSPRPTFASTTNLQHFPLNPLAKAKRLVNTRSNA